MQRLELELTRAADAQRAALERQRLQLAGTLEEQQKARRVEDLSHKAARRIANQGIIAGWTAWHEKWGEAARQRRMLAAASARLTKPQLVRCFGMWLQSWHEEAQEAATKGHNQMLREQQQVNVALSAEVERLERELGTCRDDVHRQAAAAQLG